MNYCSLEEAFMGAQPPPKFPKKKKTKEGFVPGPLAGQADPDRMAMPPPPANDVLEGPPTSSTPNDAVKLDELFPLPGDTGEPEAWQKAFTLEGSQVPLQPQPRVDGSIAVAGQSTLWRSIPVPAPSVAVEKMATIPSDINQKLESLTRQLETLSTPTPLQGTAELFLFVAIGLLMLLAIDTLLRFAVMIGSSGSRKMSGGGYRIRGPRGRWV
jgi:hypothetical protein